MGAGASQVCKRGEGQGLFSLEKRRMREDGINIYKYQNISHHKDGAKFFLVMLSSEQKLELQKRLPQDEEEILY